VHLKSSGAFISPPMAIPMAPSAPRTHCIYSLCVFVDFLASGFHCEDYTIGLCRGIIRRSYLECEAHSLSGLVFRDRRNAWKHPRVFGLFGDATGATGQKTRRVFVT
jgi:hypothetical protein